MMRLMRKTFDCILFDVDSTLVSIEGVDWLAKQKGVYEEVSRLTKLSMDGVVAIDEVFEKKLNLLAPSKYELELVGETYCRSLTEDAAGVIKAFQYLGKDVYLVTGSFEPAVRILAKKLQIPPAHVKTNAIFFKDCGCYQAIDTQGYLTKQLGKAEIVRKVGKGKRTVFIGDSVTDLATKPYVDLFIGYGGVIKREKILKEASVIITSQSLSPLLPLLLTKDELDILQKTNALLLAKAEQLIKNGSLLEPKQLYN